MRDPRHHFHLALLTFAMLACALPGPAELSAQPAAQAAEEKGFPKSDSAKPYLAFGPEDELHYAKADLGSIRQPILSLVGDDADRSLPLQILARREDGGAPRNLILELEAGATVDLTLDGPGRVRDLIVVAKGPFQAQVTDAASRARVISLRSVTPSGTGSDRAIEPGQDAALRSLVCWGTWRLVCQHPEDCNYVISSSGSVYNINGFPFHDVYWRLNRPAGSWRTVGDQGCWALWDEDPYKPGCPKAVTNCWGHYYFVQGAVPF